MPLAGVGDFRGGAELELACGNRDLHVLEWIGCHGTSNQGHCALHYFLDRRSFQDGPREFEFSVWAAGRERTVTPTLNCEE